MRFPVPDSATGCRCVFVTDDIQIETGQAYQLAGGAKHAQMADAEIGEDLRTESMAAPFAGSASLKQAIRGSMSGSASFRP